MQLHNLRPSTKRKQGKRIGRGGKRGTYSGRGMKGQRARAGHRIRPASRDLLMRIPKLRGFKNKPLRPHATVVNLNEIESKLKGTLVNLSSLQEAGIVRKSDHAVKVLGDGEVTRALTVDGVKISESARKKIEAAGGKVTRS